MVIGEVQKSTFKSNDESRI